MTSATERQLPCFWRAAFRIKRLSVSCSGSRVRTNFQGFRVQAYVVLGQFLLLRKDTELFCYWLKDVTAANSMQADDCAQCLKEWCDAFL
ncbi:barrier-to-autointegration factor A-like isoform X2 [Xiphophorus couchianus]|uniref:barrier-to-autointegration factor A-like isoform X2 n=1 Tax=Xiphophorus couchianus TaxID=32473 RepID=UPI001016B0D3|nr:barrier-to-autointegration factor A-like isoform X2 [Xiphophorus couchianus]